MIEGVLLTPSEVIIGTYMLSLWAPFVITCLGLVMLVVGLCLNNLSKDEDDAKHTVGFVFCAIGLMFLIIGTAVMGMTLGVIESKLDTPETEVIVIEDGVVVKGPGVYLEPEPEIIYRGGGIVIMEDPKR